MAALAGVAQAVSVAAPWDGQPLWWLQVLSLAALAWQLRGPLTWLRGALVGWAFSTAWLTATFWWLFISMHTYGGLAAPLAALAVVGLAAFLGSYYALACGVFTALRTRGWAATALVFGALWLLAELMRVTWFTGFPWGAGGYAHVDGPLAPLAKIIGVHGVGAVAAIAAALLAYWRPRRPGARVTGLVLLVAAAGALAWSGRSTYSQSAGRLDVALLQGNIPQDQKFQGRTGVPVALGWYGEQLARSTASFVVTPETAIPLLPAQLPPGYLAAINARFTQGEQAALVGIPLGSYEQGYTNSVLGLRPGQDAAYRFDKHHLVPFGEFIPPLFRWFTDLMHIPLGDFNRGAVGQPSFEWRGQRLAPNICYEDLFGEELGARFTNAAAAPTIFVNVSNIAWFGNTVAIDQHLQISRMRSLEFERPMIRATNTGATALIDWRGRVAQQLPRHTRGVLTGEVEGRTGLTPYARWVAHYGLWPLWCVALAVVAVAAAMGRLRRGASDQRRAAETEGRGP